MVLEVVVVLLRRQQQQQLEVLVTSRGCCLGRSCLLWMVSLHSVAAAVLHTHCCLCVGAVVTCWTVHTTSYTKWLLS